MSSIDDVHDDLYDDDELCYLTNTINKRYRGDDLNNVLYYYKPTVSVESCMVCADMASDFCSIDASTGKSINILTRYYKHLYNNFLK